MNLFNQIGTLSLRELKDLQDLVLREIQRRKVIVGNFQQKSAGRQKPAANSPDDMPATLPVEKRTPPLSPRRRAA